MWGVALRIYLGGMTYEEVGREDETIVRSRTLIQIWCNLACIKEP